MGINSKYHHITNHTQLMYTIMQVNAARADQEDEVKYKLKELYYSLQPATLLKQAFGKILHSPDTQKNLAQTGLALGTEFLISKIFKRGGSVKGFLTSLLVEKVASYALNSKSEFISNGIGKLGGLLKKFTQ
jgi:hypothetical protein